VAKLYFRYAAMNAGKNTALLQAAHNYEERGLRVRLFTAALDDRVDAAGRRVTAGEQVLIGGNDRYRAVCPSCFYGEADDPVAAPGLFG
jgi:thymidine kinase